MATERNAQQMAEFFKFTELGQMVAGRIEQFRTSHSSGDFAVISPVLIRQQQGDGLTRYLSVAIGLSTDIKIKLDQRQDVGKFFSFEFARREPTTKGSPRKIFTVKELTREEMLSLAQEVERDANDLYRKPAASQVTQSETADETEEDLPF